MQIQRLFLISLLLCVVLTGSSVGQKNKAAKPATPAAEQAAPAAAPAAPPAAAAAAAAPAAAAAASIDFAGAVTPGKPINITGTKGLVSIYLAKPTDTICGQGGIAAMGTMLDLLTPGSSTATQQVPYDPASPAPLTLQTAVDAGDKLCLYAVADASSKPYFSPTPAIVTVPAAPAIEFVGSLVTGMDSIGVKGSPGDTITVFAFPVGYTPKSNAAEASGAKPCTYADFPFHNATLAFASNGAATVKTSFSLTTSVAQTVQLADKLTSDEQLCINAVGTDGTEKFSDFATVVDATATMAVTTNPGPETPDNTPVNTPVKPEFAGAPAGGDQSVIVKGTNGSTISIYQFDSTLDTTIYKKCPDAFKDQNDQPQGKPVEITTSGTNATSTYSTPLSGTTPYTTISLKNPLIAGTYLCLDQSPSSNTKPSSPTSTNPQNGDATGSAGPTAPVAAQSGATAKPTKVTQAASKPSAATPIQPAPGAASAGNPAPSGNSVTAPTNTAVQPIATSSTASTPDEYSAIVQVTDSNKFPLGNFYYTAGAMVTNQNGSNGSSATAEYLDFGFSFQGLRENPHSVKHPYKPGFDGFLSGRFSDIPVAASSSSTSPTASAGTLNILSTQESARVMGGLFVPFPTFKTSDNNNSYFVAPLAKAAFETLLNPAATTSSSTQGANSVIATFAPVYGYYAAGLRLGMRKYPTGTDAVPETLFQGDITIGKYSNLQSFVCGPTTATPIATGQTSTNTYCSLPVTTTNGTPPVTTTTYNIYPQYRRVLPRMEFEGFFRFPNWPFVLGLDANLTQAALSPGNLDIMNKPGGSVAIYFGITGNVSTLGSLFGGKSQ